MLGTTVFVSYLRIADWWGSHTLEAFSGLRIADYKSHLRLRVADDRLEVHVVGIDRVPATRHVRDPGAHLPRPYLVESFTVYSSGVSRAPSAGTAQGPVPFDDQVLVGAGVHQAPQHVREQADPILGGSPPSRSSRCPSPSSSS